MSKVAIYSSSKNALSGGGIAYLLSIASILAKSNIVTVFFDKKVNLNFIYKNYNTRGIEISHYNKIRIPILGQFLFALFELFKFNLVLQQSLYAPRITFVKNSFIICDFPFGRIKTFNERFRINSWKNIIVNSEYTKYYVFRRWNKASIVLHPPVEFSKKINKEKLNKILCVGRFNGGDRSKRQDVVINVFKMLYDSGFKNFELTLIGFCENINYLHKLRNMIGEYPIEIIENCSLKKRKKILDESKYFVSACGYKHNEKLDPSKVEHYGISVVEAMTHGVIPLVVGKGGHLETVKNSYNGYHWQTKKQLLNYLVKLIKDKNLTKKMMKSSNLRSKKFSNFEFERKIKIFMK